MKVVLSQHERMRLYRLLAAHRADALTLHRLKELMDTLADWPEEWDQACVKSRGCKINPDGCPHRREEIAVSKRAAKIVEELLGVQSKANQLTPEHLSLVVKFAPALLPDVPEVDEESPAMPDKE